MDKDKLVERLQRVMAKWPKLEVYRIAREDLIELLSAAALRSHAQKEAP